MSKTKTANHGKFSLFLFLLLVLVLYGFGIYSIYDLIIIKYPAEFDSILIVLGTIIPFLSQGIPYLLLALVIFFVLCLILGWIILQLMRHLATPVVLFMSFLIPGVMIWIGIIISLLAPIALVGYVVLIFGVLLLLFAIWNQRRLRRAGKFVEFAARLVLEEKALLIAPIIVALFTIFAGMIMGFSFLEIYDSWGVFTEGSVELSELGSFVGLFIEYIYLIVYFGLYYIIGGFIVSYAFDWYRKEDPSLKTAWNDVRQVLSPLLWFGIIRATLEMITRVLGRGARRSATTTGKRRNEQIFTVFLFLITSVIVSIIIGLYRFFTYFTPPAIVVKKKGVRDSIRDSAKIVWNNWLDLMVGETGFGLAMFFFNIINFVLWGATGAYVGYLIFSTVEGAFVIGIVAIIFSTIPMSIVTYPMGTAFKTFLYAYALDRESGFKHPSRLPAELKGEFSQVIVDLEKRGARRKIPQPSF